MTIAAGFRCANGIVLCCDTEYTHGDSHKTYGTKIATFVRSELGFSFALAGAGNQGFMNKVFEDYADELEERIPETQAEAIARLESVLKKLYRQHIFQIPRWQDAGLDAQFLMAFRTPDGEQDFLESSLTLVSKAGQFACIGMGADVGTAIIELSAYPEMKVAEAAIASVHTLERVKITSAYCGGASAVVIQESGGATKEKRFRDISEIENSLRDLQAEITPLMLSWADDSLPEVEYKERLDCIAARAISIRNRFLHERNSWKLETQDLIEFIFGQQKQQASKPSGDHKSEPAK